MTRGALRLEVRFSLFRITHDNAGRPLSGGIAAVDPKAVQECGQVGNLGIRQSEFWHPLIGAAIPNDGSDQLTILIAQDNVGANEVRPTLGAATSIFSMTEATVRVVGGFPTGDRGRISRRTRGIRVSTAATPTFACSRILRGQTGSGDNHRPRKSHPPHPWLLHASAFRA